MKKISLLILALLVTLPALAEKRYISDELWINLRSGPGNDFRILKTLKSGTHLEFVEDDEEANFTKVITDKGLEGWVPTRFLKMDPIAFERLILTQRELEKAKADLADLQGKHSSSKKQLADSKRSANSLNKEKDKQQKELEYIRKVSANAIKLDKKNQELMEKGEELEITVDTLRAENQRLQASKDLNYILIGGGLILLGIILGLILPKMSGKRGDGWS